jgi:hypothetical protein
VVSKNSNIKLMTIGFIAILTGTIFNDNAPGGTSIPTDNRDSIDPFSLSVKQNANNAEG